MKFISIVVPLFFLLQSCNSQNLDEVVLVERIEITNLIDSLPPSLSTELSMNQREWKEPFRYIDSISVSTITYKSDGLNVNGYLIVPKKPGKHPCVIWNRGGVKEFGTINHLRASAMLGKLASKGYVVVATQYRGNGGSEGKEEFGGSEIADVLNLINVLEETPEADTSQIGMFGGSRGGMMTYIALTKTNRIKAAAVLGSPSDKYASIEDRPSIENSLIELVENYDQNKEEELDKRSPIKWADRFSKNVPILIMHGNSDWRVKSEQSLRMALELDKYRVPYKLVIFEGGDHGLSEFRNEFYQELTSWFDKYLDKNAKLPNMAFHGG